MDIIFVTSHLTLLVGGSKFLTEYANKLSEHGHKITVVSQKVDSKNYKFHRSISLIEVGGPLPSNPLYWLLFNTIKKRYLRALKTLRGDIMVSVGFPANFFCALNNKDNHILHVFYCLEPFRYFHDKKFRTDAPFHLQCIYWMLSKFFKVYDINGARAANKIICASNFIKTQIQKTYSLNSRVHYIGIETKSYSAKIPNFDLRKRFPFMDRDVPIVFALGLSHHLKGARELILVFKKILKSTPNAVLSIGGWMTRQNEKIVRNLINRLSISKENFVFCGFIEQHLLDYFYQNSTITVYTAINESYGYIPLESMKNGTPVVAFEGGPSETIVDGRTGYVVKNNNLEEFAQKSIMLLQDKALRKQLSKNAKLHVEINFSLEQSVLKLENIFQEIIAMRIFTKTN